MHSYLIVADLCVGRAISFRIGQLEVFEKLEKAYGLESDRGNQRQVEVNGVVRHGKSWRMSESGVK